VRIYFDITSYISQIEECRQIGIVGMGFWELNYARELVDRFQDAYGGSGDL
jgi:hypothetical protein